MQIPILNGVYADQVADFRTSYPRNMIPVPKDTGVSKGYLRPADGIATIGTGPGIDRGGINWRGVCYRVMGTKLVTVTAAGAVTVLGDVGGTGQVTLDYGFDRLAIWSGGQLHYWDGSTLTQVTDPDLGTVIDGCWFAGYYLSTDGANIIVTELTDPTAVNPLKYGSAESDPDQVLAVDKLRNEAYALGRYTIETFENIGGNGFPLTRIDGAHVPRGIIGTFAYAPLVESFAFVGSGRNEAPAVWLMQPGTTRKLSTREIDTILAGYSEAALATIVVESRVERGHQLLMVHLPDTCWVYDAAASAAVEEPVWFELDSGTVLARATYRARNMVWLDGVWIAGDPTSTSLGVLTDDVSTHHGASIAWEFGTLIVYNEGRGAVFHELELAALPGRVALGADPVVWTSYTLDGQTWSLEQPARAGKQGDRLKRICWRRQGSMRNMRAQRFRGTSDAHLSFARLEAQVEALQ